MGATDFSTIAFGKTAEEAFCSAVQDAVRRFGNEGYTGSIAEKSSYELVDPKMMGMTIARFKKAVVAARMVIEAQEDAMVDEWSPKRNKAAQRKLDNAVEHERKKLERLAGHFSSRILQIVEQLEDKWAPALAIEITGKAAKQIKADHGKSRCKVYRFFGTASL